MEYSEMKSFEVGRSKFLMYDNYIKLSKSINTKKFFSELKNIFTLLGTTAGIATPLTKHYLWNSPKYYKDIAVNLSNIITETLETLMVEAHNHKKSWCYLEKHLILDSKNQPDPIAQELVEVYGTWDMYVIHWIIDCDNRHGYGQQGDGVSNPSFINTFQYDIPESEWKIITVMLNIRDTQQLQMLILVLFKLLLAKEDGYNFFFFDLVAKIAKLGNYLRYYYYDKYFKKIGNCVDYQKCEAIYMECQLELYRWLQNIESCISDDLGYSTRKERVDHIYFDQEIYISSGWIDKSARGPTIKNSATFIDSRLKKPRRSRLVIIKVY
ncbi:glycoside hydrolase family 48 protein [Piromyces sp. E2]|nr:glycoside hydrolase family 48 protein [Piromyces sp. E2]|eukprot:OUM57246.1 glycoside hydrolase family 48 protein [Piromyces sp. E2]